MQLATRKYVIHIGYSKVFRVHTNNVFLRGGGAADARVVADCCVKMWGPSDGGRCSSEV